VALRGIREGTFGAGRAVPDTAKLPCCDRPSSPPVASGGGAGRRLRK